jgi:hypothetical protein
MHLAAEPDNPRSPLAVLVGSAPAPTRAVALGYVPQALASLVTDHKRLLARLDAVVPDDFNAEALLNL